MSKLCLIRLPAPSGAILALDPAAIREMTDQVPCTPMPLSSDLLAGLAHHKGAILPIFASTRIFTPAAPEPPSPAPRFLLLQTHLGQFGLTATRADLSDAPPADPAADPDTHLLPPNLLPFCPTTIQPPGHPPVPLLHLPSLAQYLRDSLTFEHNLI